MNLRRPLAILIALSLLAGATVLRADRLTYTPDAGAVLELRITPEIRSALGLPPASQPATPATAPATVPSTQPVPPVVVPPPPGPPVTLIPRGGSGPLLNTPGKPARVGERWLRADGRDPSAPGFNANADPRGPDGITIKNAASATVENVTVERCGQNIILSGIAGDALLRNVRSFDSWSLNSAAQFQGQGVYGELIAGTLTIDGCVFDRNGYLPGLPPHTQDSFGHSVYRQRNGGPARLVNSAFMRSSNAGPMLRSGGGIAGCLIADAGTGIIAMGRGDTADVSDTVIVGGHRYWDGSNWTGNTGVMSYAKALHLKNVLIVAVPGQANPDPTIAATGERSFNTACIALSSTYTAAHPDWPDPHPTIDCENVHVFGWPGTLLTLNNKVITTPPGFTFHPNTVNIDVQGLAQRVRTGKTSTAAAILEVKAAAGVN